MLTNNYTIPMQMNPIVPLPTLIYNPLTRSYEEIPAGNNNSLLIPNGYTAVVSSQPELLLQTLNQIAQYASQTSVMDISSSSDSIGFESPPRTVKHKKFPHRSKQVRIESSHREIKDWATPLGIYAKDDEAELLRGLDTCRVHVKNYEGLNTILDVLKIIQSRNDIELKKIATPISMKNKFQKKGFIVYLKTGSSSQVAIIQRIFEQFPIFKKCDIAYPNPKEIYAKKDNDNKTLVVKQNYVDANTLSFSSSVASAC